MIGIVVVSHDGVAEAMVKCCETIIGKLDCLETISFFSDEHLIDLEKKFDLALDNLSACDGILILIDMFGGSPSNIAIKKLSQNPNMEIISGFNIPMLLELISRSKIGDVKELKEKLLNRSKAGIIDIKYLIKERLKK